MEELISRPLLDLFKIRLIKCKKLVGSAPAPTLFTTLAKKRIFGEVHIFPSLDIAKSVSLKFSPDQTPASRVNG